MRVRFTKNWQGEGSASFKKDDEVELDESLAWDLALLGYVKLKKPLDQKIERLKKEAKEAKRASKLQSSRH